MEIWRDIPGYEGFYQVSTYGNVRSLERTVRRPDGVKHTTKGRVLSQNIIPPMNYRSISLVKDRKYRSLMVHYLVVLTFYGEIANGYVIDHRDADTSNNHIDNLWLITHRANLSKEKLKKNNIIGVSKRDNKWVAQLQVCNIKYCSVRFSTKDEALEDYDRICQVHSVPNYNKVSINGILLNQKRKD